MLGFIADLPVTGPCFFPYRFCFLRVRDRYFIQAYAATGDLATDTNTFKLPHTFFLCFAVQFSMWVENALVLLPLKSRSGAVGAPDPTRVLRFLQW